MTNADSLKRAADQIRVSDAVVLLGAGTSDEAGMPLAGQLPPLVWHALDAHPDVLRRLASALGTPHGRAKDIVADHVARIRTAFGYIATDPSCRKTFQATFATLNRERAKNASLAHDALARLVYSKHVIRVVSLNWDTLLESAFARRYGVGLNAQAPVLSKPHGDCANPDADWILPHEDGFVSDAIVTDLLSLATQRPRVLLIVGYSARDSAVLQRLVDPLAERWRVFRLSPRATGEGAIRFAASDGLLALAKTLCSDLEVPGWEFVTFERQRGIEAAVSGERLGPRDVDACPRLPHYESAQLAIQLLHRVNVAGPPGCGKSITTWQLAHDHNRSGWHVLRPASPHPPDLPGSLDSVRTDHWNRVLVVDDAQTLSAHFIDQLNELASSRLIVITATTDAHGEQPRAIRIPAQVAVETLATDFRRRRDELLPIVQLYDSRIGDAYSATPLESRIDEAAKSDTPWHFTFVLRGGWMHAREQLNTLRDFDRADLLFFLIAARQLLSLDAGSDPEEIASDAQAMGRTENWVAAGIDLLRRQGAISASLPLRCLHIRAAIVVIDHSLNQRREDTFPPLLAALRRMVYHPDAPVRGIHWLMEHVLGADAFRNWRRDEDRFYEPAHLEALVQRLLSGKDALARRHAAFLMSRLLWYGEVGKDRLRAHFLTLREWLDAATKGNCYALGDLVNSIGRDKPYDELVESMDPERLWRNVQDSRPTDGYGWGHFLGRLAYAGRRKWRARAIQAMDQDRLRDLVSRFTADDLHDLSEFIQGLASFDLDFAVECLQIAMPTLQGCVAANAFKAYCAMRELEFYVLGHGIFLNKRPSRTQKDLSRQITEAIRPMDVATGIQSCRFGDWETYARLLTWVKTVNPNKHRLIVSAISWDELERRSVGFWQRPPRELRLLLSCLTADKKFEPVRSWVFEHADQIQEIDPILAGISPETAIAILYRGGRVNLAGHNASDWELQRWALARVAQMDAGAARRMVESNVAHIVEGLSKLGVIDSEKLARFLAFVRELDRAALTRFTRRIEPQVVAQKWPGLLNERRAKVRRGARKVLEIVSQHSTGEVKELADSLLRTDNAHK